MAERDYVTADSPYSSADSAPAYSSGAERSADEIRNNIAATRDSITETVDQLSSRVQRTLDWKTYVADYPLAAAGAAAGLGILLGYFIQPRATPSQRINTALADMIEDTACRFQQQLDGVGLQRPGMGQTLRATALATLVQAAGNFARDKFAEKKHGLAGDEGSYYADDTDAAYRADARHLRDY